MKNLMRGFSLLLLSTCLIFFNACTKDDDLLDGASGGNSTATCTDGIQNGDETGVDCGGSCDPCEAEANCTDGIQNGDETGVDCGGTDCPPCTTATNMLDYISTAPQFSMLKAAIERANFAENLEGAGPNTFFAPNNDAWQALLDGNGWVSVDQISMAVLNIVLETQFSKAGSYTSDQFVNNFQITVLYQSKTIHIDLNDPNNPTVVAGLTSASIVGPDKVMTNGVIHEIDKVILF